MAQQLIINIGESVNDKRGDPLRTAFDKVNQNFTELFNTDTSTKYHLGDDVQFVDIDAESGMVVIQSGFDTSMPVYIKGANCADGGVGGNVVIEAGGAPLPNTGTTGNIELAAQQTTIDSNNNIWSFRDDGILELPDGGDIVDSNGDSVLGGTGGSSDRLVNGLLEVVLDNNGTITTPLLLPTTFTAVFDPAHKMGSPIVLSGTPWSIEVTFRVDARGEVETLVNAAINPSNPGYTNNNQFAFTEADHGIPGYTLEIALTDIENVGGPSQPWTANVLCSLPPDYPSTISSADAIKLTADTSSWVFGPTGYLAFPGTGNIVAAPEGLIVEGSGAPGSSSIGLLDTGVNITSQVDITLTTDGGAGGNWVFGTDGNLTIPGEIKSEAGTGDVVIEANDGTARTWTFGSDGGLTFPDTLSIKDSIIGYASSDTISEEIPGGTISETTTTQSQIEIDTNRVVIAKRVIQVIDDGVVTSTDEVGSTLEVNDNGAIVKYYVEPEGPNNTSYFKVSTTNAGAILEGFQQEVSSTTHGRVIATQGVVVVETSRDNVVNEWGFTGLGGLELPTPTSAGPFTLTFAATNYVATGPKPTLTLTATPWELEGQYVYAPNGESQLILNDPFPYSVNPGYESGDAFTFDISVHGILEFTLTITLNEIQEVSPGAWIATVAESAAPVYPDTILAGGAIKLSNNTDSSWIFGTDGKLTFPNGSTYGTSTLVGAKDEDLTFTVRYRPTVSVVAASGSTTGRLKVDITANDDITAIETGNDVWEFNTGTEQDPVWKNVTSEYILFGIEFDVLVTGFEFVEGETYTFRNTTATSNSWHINNNTGTLIAPGGAILSSEASIIGEGTTYRDFSIELATPNGNNEYRWLFANDTGAFTVPGPINATFGTGALDFDSGDLGTSIVRLSTTDTLEITDLILHPTLGISLTTNRNVAISAGAGSTELYNIWFTAEIQYEMARLEDIGSIFPDTRPWAGMPSYQAFDVIAAYEPPSGVLPVPSSFPPIVYAAKQAYLAWQEELAATNVTIDVAGNDWVFGQNGAITFPDATTTTGKSITVPLNQSLTVNLSKSMPSISTTFKVSSEYIKLPTGNGTIISGTETAANSWGLDSANKTLFFPDAGDGVTPRIYYSKADGVTGMELMTYAKSIKITAAQTNSWTFGTDGSLTFPDATVQETAFQDVPSHLFFVHPNPGRTFTATGTYNSPFATITAATDAAVAAGHSDSDPATIILLANITENVTLKPGIYLTSLGTGTHGSPNITGTVTVTSSVGTVSSNHYSISNLRIIAPTNGHCINFTGTAPQKLFVRDMWLDANGTGDCLYVNNSGSGSTVQFDIGHLAHSGTGDVYCINVVQGGCYVTDIETSGAVQVAAVQTGAVLTIDSSELDANGDIVCETYGTGSLTITNSLITNTMSGSTGIQINDAGGTVTLGNNVISVPSGAGYAVKGPAGGVVYHANNVFTANSYRSTGLGAGFIALPNTWASKA